VRADVAPPGEPPGSSIAPGQNTRVKMVAENVLLVVKPSTSGSYSIEVTADFAMQNLGDVDESMQVRFPLEDVSGWGNGYGKYPTVRDFKARVNRLIVPVITKKEAYQKDSDPIRWAAFDVTFPRGQVVPINVSYTTDLPGDSWPEIKYIIGTGAGWYQSIGTATVTVRLPYPASEGNLYYSNPSNVTIIGKEVRWHWRDYEPAVGGTILLAIVSPNTWKQILDLEAQTGSEPDNIDAAVKLSQIYVTAGSEKHGCMANSKLASLAEIAVEQALALHPNEVKLHAQLAETYYRELGCGIITQPGNEGVVTNLEKELNIVLKLDPKHARALEIKSEFEQQLADARITPTPAP